MADEKHFYLGRLFSEYLEASIRFREFSNFYDEKALSYPVLEEDTRQPRAFFDDGGIFFRLKELAHKTRKTYEKENSDKFETSLCWVVETVCSDMFHGLTMVRESFYKSYKNSHHGNQLRVSDIKQEKGYGHEEVMESLELILEIDERSQVQAGNQFSDLNKIVDIPMKMFKYLLGAERDNHCIRMAIYNSLDNMKTLYGEEETQDFLRQVYGSDETDFFVECRESLIEEGYYDEAIKVNERLPESVKQVLKLPEKEIELPEEDYLR